MALVSDAGAPAVSDPGARVVRAVREAGYAVVPVPGPSAVIAALMGSGVTSDENPAFAFAGFAPPKAAARQRWLRTWCALPAPVVMFESPHRLAATLADLLEVCGPARKLTVARELTKRFEEIATFALGEGAAWLAADPHREQGEFVLIVHADEAAEDEGEVDARADALLDALLETLSVRDAAKVAAKVTGLPRTRCTAGRCARRPPATGSRRDRGSHWHGLCNGRVRQARRPRRTAGLPGHAHAAGRDAPGRQRQGPARGMVHRPGAAAFVRRLAARRIESDPGTGTARAGGVVRQDRRAFEVALDPVGTPFQHEVWRALCALDFGVLTSYGELARTVGRPKGAQAIGGAVGRNPLIIIIPCHRVIGSDTSLTGFGGGLPRKQALLAHEGNLYVSRSPRARRVCDGQAELPW